MKRIPDDLRQEALRLRLQERLSLDAICHRTGLGKGTLSVLLREYPLTSEEVSQRKSESALRSNPLRKYTPQLSKHAQMMEGVEFSTDQKGRMAESAVLFRLAMYGYKALRDVFEGNKVDMFAVREDTDRYIKIQVKWARRCEIGRPIIDLRNGEHGKIRYLSPEDCNFVVAYNFETDITFVFPVEICLGKTSKTCDEEYAEAWHLLEM